MSSLAGNPMGLLEPEDRGDAAWPDLRDGCPRPISGLSSMAIAICPAVLVEVGRRGSVSFTGCFELRL